MVKAAANQHVAHRVGCARCSHNVNDRWALSIDSDSDSPPSPRSQRTRCARSPRSTPRMLKALKMASRVLVGGHRRHPVIPVVLVVCPYGEIVGLIRLCFHAAACKVCGESLYDAMEFDLAALWLGHHLIAAHGVVPCLIAMRSGITWLYEEDLIREPIGPR
jgi:hypothetical protein